MSQICCQQRLCTRGGSGRANADTDPHRWYMLCAVCVMFRSVLRQSAVSLASLEIGASTNGHADAAAMAAAHTRTVTGVLTSRPTSRDIKIDGFSMGLNGVELIQARLVLTLPLLVLPARGYPSRQFQHKRLSLGLTGA